MTSCDSYVGPLGQFTLDVARFDIGAFALTDATVELNVTYTGQLLGQNTSTVTPCWWSFNMNLGLASGTMDLTPYTFNAAVLADGEIPVAGGVDPNTVNVPLSGTIVAGYAIPWTVLSSFYSDQVLSFTTPSFGGVAQMGGAGIFSFGIEISAEVCVTYSYDNAVALEEESFGALKAMYR
ncbi:MAG: hypothetical protein IPG61_06225 [bacterium]|nr:hypothetical protein [bacterium]MBK7670356.1 hypothetical protein [bacterium]